MGASAPSVDNSLFLHPRVHVNRSVGYKPQTKPHGGLATELVGLPGATSALSRTSITAGEVPNDIPTSATTEHQREEAAEAAPRSFSLSYTGSRLAYQFHPPVQ